MIWIDDMRGILDALLIFFYRIPDNPVLGMFLGTSVLCVACSVTGVYTGLLFSLLNRSHSKTLKQETVSMHNLSMKAIAAGDKAGYTGCNKLANEAFGRYFFAQFGEGAAALLPIPFALGWMQGRFEEVRFALPLELPGIGDSVGYLLIFVLMYILTRILLRRVVLRLPFVNRIHETIRLSEPSEKMLGFSEAIPDAESSSQPVPSFAGALSPPRTP